ncbi:MAG: bifunctional glutamate N-acetyltransferase/amino-acid acetyltransferase ArgJ [Planctomycetes bacterium]|nr:bifunctional glutamate N-acetyltransferase/amino-acid acetyltransferase ArgJ [Planctomycetota bacterium]
MGTPDAIEAVPGGVLAARGFRAAGVPCGIKQRKGQPDLALVVADGPAAAAGTLTLNHVKAAPVRWCRKILRRNRPVRAIVVNSGNANACTGSRGDADAAATAEFAAARLAVSPEEVLVSSTGVIGHYLPMEKVQKGIDRAAGALARGPEAGSRFAQAILTTDTRRKEFAVRVSCGRAQFFVGGCAKGAGMIGPRMATMLAYVTTDARVEAAALRRALGRAVQQSFNAISVDGHTSTNDTAVILSSGSSGVAIRSPRLCALFQAALDRVTLELAKAIVRDGEGATKLVQIQVAGARSHAEARRIAHTMARSPLNMTAIHGGDPNWGRFVSSAGYAGPRLVEARTQLFINGLPAYLHGLPAATPVEKLAAEMRRPEITLLLDLGLGRGIATVWGCDLSRDYITINADYHT